MPVPAVLSNTTTIHDALAAAAEALDTLTASRRAIEECIAQSKRCVHDSRAAIAQAMETARRVDGNRL